MVCQGCCSPDKQRGLAGGRLGLCCMLGPLHVPHGLVRWGMCMQEPCVPQGCTCASRGCCSTWRPVRAPAMLAGVKGSHSHVKGGQDPETKSNQAATPQGGARTCNVGEQAATCHV